MHECSPGAAADLGASLCIICVSGDAQICIRRGAKVAQSFSANIMYRKERDGGVARGATSDVFNTNTAPPPRHCRV